MFFRPVIMKYDKQEVGNHMRKKGKIFLIFKGGKNG